MRKTTILGSETTRATVVGFRGRFWKTENEIGNSAGAALTVLECAFERGEKLSPGPGPRGGWAAGGGC